VVEDDELRREVPAPSRAGFATVDEEIVRGVDDAADVVEVALVAETDDGARPMTGGVDTFGVPGLDDFGVDGLDQLSKKSSSASSLGAGADTGSIPSTKIPFGYLIADLAKK